MKIFSLKTILIVPFTALIIIIAGIIGYLSFLNGQKAVNNVSEQLQNEISKRIEDHISAFLNLPQQINHVNAISIQKGQLNARNVTSLEHHFWNQVKVFRSVSSIYFGNSLGGLVNSGREKNSNLQYIIVTDNFKSGAFKKYNTDALGNRKDLLFTVPNFDARTRQWYRGAIESGTQFWSPIYILFTGQDLAIAASRPAYDNKGSLLGVISIDLFLSHISSFLENLDIGKTGHAFIMEDSGFLIASSTRTKLFTMEKEGKKRKRLTAIESESSLIRHAATSLKNKFNDFKSITTELQISFEVDHQRYLLQVKPIERNGLKWLISVIIPENDFMSKIKEGNRLTAIFILLALIIVLFACIFLANRIVSPIFPLISAAQSLSKGKWQSKIIKNSRIFEINVLTHSFNQMADKLQKSLDILHIEVNERKQAEEKLRKRETYLRTVIETIPDLVWLKDPEGVYLSCNKKFERFFGAKEKEIIGKTDYDFVDKSLADFFREKDKISLEAGKSSVNEEEVVYAEDGHSEWLETIKTPMYDLNGNLVGVLGVGRDITLRKETEETIRLNKERLNSILQANPNPVVVYDTNGFVQFINPSFTEVFGWTASEIRDKKIPFVPDDEKNITFSKIKEIYNNGKPLQFFTKRLTKSNEVLDININAAVYKDFQGKKIGLVVNLTDITEQIKMQDQLRQAQKMESVGRLAGGVAHDFNNILNVILGHSELALSDISESNPAYANIKKIRKAGFKAADIVRQLLSFGRNAGQELRALKLSLIINDSLKFLRSLIPSNIEIKKEFSAKNEIIFADPVQINQIIMNLCINASQEMKNEGGTIKICIEDYQIDGPHLNGSADLKQGLYVKMTVTDTGSGIDPQFIDRIFDPYFTTKGIGEGSGMGLFVVHGIVKAHNGVIQVSSKHGKGTEFEIFLPLIEEKPHIEEKSEDKVFYGHERILFVDDDKTIAEMTKESLERIGFKVETRSDPLEAIELFKLESENFDLVITDMTMPNLTGEKLAQRLLKIKSNIPIIICTGYSALIDDKQARQIGVAGFLMKPVTLSTLSKTIREVLGSF